MINYNQKKVRKIAVQAVVQAVVQAAVLAAVLATVHGVLMKCRTC